MPVVLVALPTELAQSGMPPGFTVVADDPVTHTVEYRGLTCARIDGREAPTGLLDAALRVMPPPEFMDASITDYEVSYGADVQGDLRATLLSWMPNASFNEAVITSTQTSLGAAATGTVESRGTNNITVTLRWSAAGPGQEAGRTTRLFLVDSGEVLGAIDVIVSDSNVLSSGTGYMMGGRGVFQGALPGKGALVYSDFSMQMFPARLPAETRLRKGAGLPPWRRGVEAFH